MDALQEKTNTGLYCGWPPTKNNCQPPAWPSLLEEEESCCNQQQKCVLLAVLTHG